MTLLDHSVSISPTCWPLTLSEVFFKILSVGNLQFSTDVNDMDARRFILLNMRVANRMRYSELVDTIVCCMEWWPSHCYRWSRYVFRSENKRKDSVPNWSIVKFLNNHRMFTMHETDERPVEALPGLLHPVVNDQDLFLFWSPADVLDLCQSRTNSTRLGCPMIHSRTHQRSRWATRRGFTTFTDLKIFQVPVSSPSLINYLLTMKTICIGSATQS